MLAAVHVTVCLVVRVMLCMLSWRLKERKQVDVFLEPSYVLRALGRKDELASSSIRFSFGRFTTEEDVDYTLTLINHAVDRLRELSPLWEMYLDGIDLDTVDWQTH